MSSTPTSPDVTAPRVRDRFREALAVMAFSAACSAGAAVALVLLTQLLARLAR